MILGIGSDIVQIPRILALLNRYGEKFIERVFTEEERQGSEKFSVENTQLIAAYYAKRFAAKEALAKAVGMGFRKYVTMKDISIINDALGKPVIKLSDKLDQRLRQSVGNKQIQYHVSLSDDYPIAMAFVICEYV